MSGVIGDVDVKNFDDLLLKWCGHGRWQYTLLGLLSLVFFFAPFFTMSVMFIGATPQYRCADGLRPNASFADLSNSTSQCSTDSDNITLCTRWVFDNSTFYSTIVTEWQLVCSRRYLLSLAQALLMFGGLVGSMITSQLGDVVGRKPVFVVAIVCFVGGAFTAALTSSLTVFCISRFISGATISMMIEGEMVIIAELVPPSKRAKYIFLMMAPFPMSIAILSALAYWVRDHTTLQLILAAPTTLLLLNLLILPESPRWLVQRGEFGRALAVFGSGASWNGRCLDAPEQQQRLLAQMRRVCRQEQRTATRHPEPRSKCAALCSTLGRNLKELFSTSRMRINVFISIFLRFAACGSYYGLSFDIAQLSRNPFLAVALSGMVEVPVYFTYSLINRLGRVPCTAASFAISATVLFLSFVPAGDTFWLINYLIAKISMATSFCMVYIHTPEYLPTSVRALGSALSQTAMRFGGAMAAFVVYLLSEWHTSLPAAIFGSFTLAACLLSFLLPETVNKELPETVPEVDLLYRSSEKSHENRRRPNASLSHLIPEPAPSASHCSELSHTGDTRQQMHEI